MSKKHKHRCLGCAKVWDCYQMPCVGAGSCPPPEGYLDICQDCDESGEGPTGCMDDNDALGQALRGMTQQDLNKVLDETLK